MERVDNYINSMSIIIPIKSENFVAINQFSKYIYSLEKDLAAKDFSYEIIIANECINEYSELLIKELHNSTSVKIIVPTDRTGKNDKMNGILAAMEASQYEYIFIIDDHYRITADEYCDALQSFNDYDLFKVVPIFDDYPVTVMIDEAGFFFRCITDKTKQFAGHIAMKKELYRKYSFPSRNGLYDEYTIESYYAKKGAHIGFPRHIFFSANQSITLSKFIEQRIRYSYENIAFPLRFCTHLMFLPCFLIVTRLCPKIALLLFLLYCLLILAISYHGQHIYGNKSMPNVFLYAPIWHLAYWITSWMALFLFVTGSGVRFGGIYIHKPK